MHRSNHTLYALFALFFVPFFLACALYFSTYHPHTTNQGHLLSPTLQADMLETTHAERTWKLIYLAPKTCTETCLEDLHQLDNIWRSMRKNQPRIQPLVLSPGTVSLSHFPQIRYQSVPKVIKRAQKQAPNAFVFIADPLNNLIMAYTHPTWPKALFGDLKKLLHISQIG